GDEAVLTLRGGGEMTCASRLIVRIAPDEVPHPPGRDGVGRDGAGGRDGGGRDGVGRDGSPSRPQSAPQASGTAGTSHQERFEDGSESRPYQDVIAQAARRHNVDPRLVHAVITVESGYRPRARSPRGALGMMQLMPGT